MEEKYFADMEILISTILKKNSIEVADSLAIVSDNIFLSYSELNKRVEKVIDLLRKETLSTNSCVALRFKNHLNHLIFYLALFKMRITQISVNPFDVINIQKKTILNVEVNLILQDFYFDNLFDVDTIFINKSYKIHKRKFESTISNDNKYVNKSVLFLSSGTTSKQKVIALNSNTFSSQIRHDTFVCPFNENEKFYSYSEIYYQFPKRRTIVALLNKMTIYLPQKKTSDIIGFSKKYNIDHLLLTADQANNILLQNSDNLEQKIHLPNLKSCVLSSSSVNEPLRKKVLTLISKNLYISYGTNEFGNISEATPNDILNCLSSVGKINKNVKYKILNDNKKECKVGEVGNILVSYPTMFKEYVNNKEATKKAFIGNFFSPGDLGRINSLGDLIIEGRKDDMMIFSGVNIYPRELEDVLESHPNVIESAVFPITINNQRGIPVAIVVSNKELPSKELSLWCSEFLGWRIPQKIFFTKSLPKNPTGKVLKNILKEKVYKILTPSY